MALEAYAAYPVPGIQHQLANALELLLFGSPEAHHVRDWLQQRNPEGAHPFQGGIRPIAYTGTLPLICDYWEADLYLLVQQFAVYPRLSAWDMTEKDSRHRHARRVARHARDLANALEEPSSPEYPPILALLDETDALLLAECMPAVNGFVVGNNLPEQPPPLDTAAGRLGFQFSEPQLLAVLRRLADWADQAIHVHSPVARHKTGDPQARIFACDLSRYMIANYGNPWDRIVADCVVLKYPDLKTTPTEEVVRGWTGRK